MNSIQCQNWSMSSSKQIKQENVFYNNFKVEQ